METSTGYRMKVSAGLDEVWLTLGSLTLTLKPGEAIQLAHALKLRAAEAKGAASLPKRRED